MSKTFKAENQKAAEKMFNAWVVEMQENYRSQDDLSVEKLIKTYFHEHCERKIKAGKMSSSTLDGYMYTSRRIIAGIGHIPCENVSFSDLEQLFAEIAEDDLSEKYVYEHFILLKTIFNYAVMRDFIQKNIFKNKEYARALGFSKKPSVKIRVFEDHEIVTILEEIKNNSILHGVVMLCRDTGARRSEIMGLQLKHLNFRENTIRVEQQLKKKGGKFYLEKPKTEKSIRDVPMTKELYVFLKKYVLSRKKQIMLLGGKLTIDDFAIANELNQPVDPNLITRWFRESMESLGEKEVDGKPEKWKGRGLHCLRHTYASNMIKAGVDVVDVSALIGHHAPSFTADTYCHGFQNSKKEAVARYEKFLAERANLETADVCDILRDI
ncbi:MAG TPA: site-specific integrase [Firmicutes bacterium]|nr:site-specific integrase [Bacillota bacterium]